MTLSCGRMTKSGLFSVLQLAVDFIFCHVLIEVLKQLSYHPGYDSLIDRIVDMAFTRFKLGDRYVSHHSTAHYVSYIY